MLAAAAGKRGRAVPGRAGRVGEPAGRPRDGLGRERPTDPAGNWREPP